MQSVFVDRELVPNANDLQKALGKTHAFWNALVDHIISEYPSAKLEWKYSSEKYVWSFLLKDKKRVIVYLLPRAGFFKAAFVFSQKAIEEILRSDIVDAIKNELVAAKKFAEGRGIRIDVKTKATLTDIKKLIQIKLRN